MITIENVTFPDLWPWRPAKVYEVVIVKPEGRVEINYHGRWPPVFDDVARLDDLSDSLLCGKVQ